MVDLAVVLANGERLKEVGGALVGESDATLREIVEDFLQNTFQDTATTQWTYNDTLNQLSVEAIPVNDATFATPSASEFPSTLAVKTYVDAATSGAGGDVDSSDLTVAGWSWVTRLADPTTSTDT